MLALWLCLMIYAIRFMQIGSDVSIVQLGISSFSYQSSVQPESMPQLMLQGRQSW